ncbi:MAG: hypothetical protein NT069_12910, partial [Planctomycetota bacterium]|nr:hypothetical protein [Planctomycetota bacterium]
GKKGKSTSAARLQLRYIYAAIAAVVLLSIGWWGFFGRPKARTTETETHVADGEPRREDTKGTLPTNPKKKEPRSGKNADDSEKPRDAAQANDGSDREPGLHNTKPDPPRTVDPIPPKVATTPNGTAQQMPDATAETAGNPQPDNDRPAIVDKAGSPQPVPSPAAPPSMTTAAEERSTFRGLSKAIRVPIKALSESPQPIPNIGNKDGSGPISCKLHGPLVKTGDKPVQPAKDYYEIRGELIDGKHYDIQRRNRKGDSWTSVASIHLRGQPTIALRTLESEDKFALLSLYSCVVEFEYPKSFPEFAFFVDDKWVWQRFGNMDHNAPTIPIQRSSPFVTAEYPLVIHKARLEVPPNVNPIDAKQTFTTEMTLPIEKRSQTPVLGFSIDSARSILQIEGPELRSQSGNAGSNQPTSAAARAKKDSLDKRITSFAISVYKTTKTDLERKKEIRGGSPKAIRKAYGDVADDFRSTASKINDLKDPDVETEFSNAKVIVGKQNAIYDDAVELAKTLYPSATGNSVPKLNMPITAPSKREYIKKFGEEFPKWQNEFLSFWEKAAVDIAEMDSARPVPWKAIVTGTVCRVYSPVWEGDGEARNLVGGVYTEIAELVPKSK